MPVMMKRLVDMAVKLIIWTLVDVSTQNYFLKCTRDNSLLKM